ncbi:hypothetical protein V6N13_092056 [Hibiscus sabdariffa]
MTRKGSKKNVSGSVHGCYGQLKSMVKILLLVLGKLATDLEIENSHSFTFMTNRQKGLMDVVPELFPYSAHRTGVRHLYSNAKTSGVFIGKALKDQLWKAARATYVTRFQSTLDELKLRRPGTKTTPTTSQDTTTQTPSSTSTEPSHPNVFRWIPHPEYLLVKTIVAITYLQVQHQHLLVKTIVTVNHLQGLILDYGGTRILLRTQ